MSCLCGRQLEHTHHPEKKIDMTTELAEKCLYGSIAAHSMPPPMGKRVEAGLPEVLVFGGTHTHMLSSWYQDYKIYLFIGEDTDVSWENKGTSSIP